MQKYLKLWMVVIPGQSCPEIHLEYIMLLNSTELRIPFLQVVTVSLALKSTTAFDAPVWQETLDEDAVLLWYSIL